MKPPEECWCRAIDADQVDARDCPLHGPGSEIAREGLRLEAVAERQHWRDGVIADPEW